MATELAVYTAESFTRNLRTDSESELSRLELASKLLSGELDVYIPRREIVLLHWILDYLNLDTAKWKFLPQSWALAERLWRAADDDSREQAFVQHNIILLLINTLERFSQHMSDINEELTQQLASFVSILVRTRKTYRASDLDEIKLFTAFFTFTSKGPVDQFQHLTTCMLPILSRLLHNILVGSRLNQLASESMTSMLILLTIDGLPQELESFIYQVFEAIFKSDEKIDVLSYLVPLLKGSLAAELGSHGSIAATSLYLAYLQSPKQKCAIAEFSRLARLSPQSLRPALEALVRLRLIPSDEALQEVLTRESTNWPLLQSVLALKSELVLSNTQHIAAIANENSDEALSLARDIVSAYGQSRDLISFIKQWRRQLDKPNSLWTHRVIIEDITRQLSYLSVHQVDSLLQVLIESLDSIASETVPSSVYLPLQVVIRSLESFTQDLSILEKDFEKVFENTKILVDSRFWDLKARILSLSPVFIISFRNTLETQLTLEAPNDQVQSWTTAFSVIFRCKEFSDIDDFNKIVKMILKSLSKHPAGLSAVSNRWLLLIESSFDDENMDRLANVYIQNLSYLEELMRNDLLYEQKSFCRRIIDKLGVALKENSDLSSRNIMLQIIARCPIEIFSKSVRLELLDAILDVIIDFGFKSSTVTLAAINSLLQWPTFSSKIERDPAIIQKIFKSANSPIIKQILAKLIRHHSSNSGNAASQHYISSVTGSIDEKLSKKFSNKRLDRGRPTKDETWILEFASVVAQDSRIDSKFRETAVRGILYFVSTWGMSSAEKLGLVQDLGNLISQGIAQELRIQVSRVAGQLAVLELKAESRNNELLDIIFTVLCISTEEADFTALLALALQLHQSATVCSQFVEAIQSTGYSRYSSLLESVIERCFQVGEKNIQSFHVLSSFANALCKEKHAGVRPQFVRVVSQAVKKCQGLSFDALYILSGLFDTMIREQSWVVSQHMLELILSFIARVTGLTVRKPGPDSDQLFTQLTRVCSSVLLFHRHRIDGRYHLVLRVFIQLLSCLTEKSDWNTSHVSSLAYSRLLSNLCEPPVQSIREKGGKSNLTSSSALTKRALARHLPILLVNYVHLSLACGFASDIQEGLRPGVYSVFEVLGIEGVKVTSALVDSPARAYLKILYDDYAKNGKWQG